MILIRYAGPEPYRLFAIISRLRDARIGKDILGTFPVKPGIFPFPLDLLFHIKHVEVNELKTQAGIGSDHLPLFAVFTLTPTRPAAPAPMPSDLRRQANSIIADGEVAVQEEE